MAGKVRTWVWVVVAIFVVGVLGLVAMAGIGFYFVTRHIDTQDATPADARREFQSIRAGFEGQQPIIELDKGGEFLRAHLDRPTPAPADGPEHLHLLAFDPSDGRIVRFSLPFWLLRLKSGNATIDLNGNRMDLEDLRLTVEDLERLGPSLILDHETPEGERVLVWSR